MRSAISRRPFATTIGAAVLAVLVVLAVSYFSATAISTGFVTTTVAFLTDSIIRCRANARCCSRMRDRTNGSPSACLCSCRTSCRVMRSFFSCSCRWKR